MGQHLVERALILGPAERRPAGEQLVERGPEAVDVGANIDRAAIGGLFGGHVVGRAHRLARAGHLVVGFGVRRFIAAFFHGGVLRQVEPFPGKRR